VIAYPYFITTFFNLGDRFMFVFPWAITHIFILLSHCNRFYFLCDWSSVKMLYFCNRRSNAQQKRKISSSSNSSTHSDTTTTEQPFRVAVRPVTTPPNGLTAELDNDQSTTEETGSSSLLLTGYYPYSE